MNTAKASRPGIYEIFTTLSNGGVLELWHVQTPNLLKDAGAHKRARLLKVTDLAVLDMPWIFVDDLSWSPCTIIAHDNSSA